MLIMDAGTQKDGFVKSCMIQSYCKSVREILCCVCILQKVWPDSDTLESLDDITSHKISPNIRQFFRYFENLSILSKQTVPIFGLLK